MTGVMVVDSLYGHGVVLQTDRPEMDMLHMPASSLHYCSTWPSIGGDYMEHPHRIPKGTPLQSHHNLLKPYILMVPKATHSHPKP